LSGSNGDLECIIEPNHDNSYFDIAKDEAILKLRSMGLLSRSSEDKSMINAHGRRLIDLCVSSRLLILNDRIGSDKGVGTYTRIDKSGKTLVDYMLGSPQLFALVYKIFNIQFLVLKTNYLWGCTTASSL